MKPRVVCVGANLESEIVFNKLIERDVNVVGLVTLPTGAISEVSDYRDLHGCAEDAGIEVVETEDINSAKTLSAVRALNPDYVFVLGWSQVLKAEALSVASRYIVGSHPTPLPKRRGRAPIPWTILDRVQSSAVTLFKMSRKVDDGLILVQKSFDLPVRPFAMDVYLLAAEALSDAYIELYQKIVLSDVKEMVQEEKFATYRGKRSPQDGFLDFSQQVDDVDCLVRAVSRPYPGAYFYHKNHKVVVWGCELYDGPERVGIPGQVLAKQKEGLVVSAVDGCLILRDFEISGEKIPLSYFNLGDVFNYRVDDEIHDLRQRVANLEALLLSKQVEEK
ncbi:methionyl-tRNA formyltransferase [Halomonas faecis]|uniref:methionyl-tRNA formyltransferase n=1 Tax=Halomonas faecis TaxID=1562110 RepID=UPI0013D157E3|nr:formyltransferase family protein [Halomonas faecis]